MPKIYRADVKRDLRVFKLTKILYEYREKKYICINESKPYM